jgi:UDP:flavonoid glycosyltransferase YjiC (YdhE family)
MRLLMAWELGLGLGHLASLVPLARALRAEGHECLIAARDVSTVAGLADHGFARVLPAPLWLKSRVVSVTHGHGQVIADAGFADDDGLAGLVASWLDLFALTGVEGLVADYAPAALLAAHVAGLPSARLGTAFTCPPGRAPLPLVQGWNAPAGLAPGATEAVADRVVRQVCRRFGALVLAGLAALYARAPDWLTSWPELVPAGHGDARRMTGPLTAFAGSDPPEWPAAAGPKVLVYHPLERQQGIGLGAALAELQLAGLWVASPVPDAIPLPPGIALQPAGIDMAAALMEASLLVHRGGHYSALDALAAGVPQLLLPDTLEAEFNARALIAAGVAERAVPGALASQMAALLRADSPVRQRAAQVAAGHAGHGRAAATAQLAGQIVARLRRDGTGADVAAD